MFEQLFDRTVSSTGYIGATSGSANFQESSAVVGDTLHADFAWTDARIHAGVYARMWIFDPDDYGAAAYIELLRSNWSITLDCTASKVGTYFAVLDVWDGSNWLTYTDTVVVSAAVVTSGSANFQESSAVVGDTLHADFAWTDARIHAGVYARMWIFDPDDYGAAAYIELLRSNWSITLDCTASKVGTYFAVLDVWDGSNWLTYTDTVVVTEVRSCTGAIDIPSMFYSGPFKSGTNQLLAYLGMLNTGVLNGCLLYAKFVEFPGESNETQLGEVWQRVLNSGDTAFITFYWDIPAGLTAWPLGVKVWGDGETEPAWGTSGTSIFNVGIGENGEIPWGTILAVGGAVVALFATIFLARR